MRLRHLCRMATRRVRDNAVAYSAKDLYIAWRQAKDDEELLRARLEAVGRIAPTLPPPNRTIPARNRKRNAQTSLREPPQSSGSISSHKNRNDRSPTSNWNGISSSDRLRLEQLSSTVHEHVELSRIVRRIDDVRRRRLSCGRARAKVGCFG